MKRRSLMLISIIIPAISINHTFEKLLHRYLMF